MKKIALYGAGGHAYAMLGVLDALDEYQPTIVYDDAPRESTIMGVPVDSYRTQDSETTIFCISIGDNKARAQVAEHLSGEFPVLCHPKAVVGTGFQAGEGCMILAGSIIDTDVQIGRFTILNNQSTLSHNVRVGEFCHIAINVAIAGRVTIGNRVLIGAGAVVLPGITIADGAVIGAGAVVTKNVPKNAVMVGNPGKIIRYE